MEEEDPTTFAYLFGWILGEEPHYCGYQDRKKDFREHQLQYCKLFVMANKFGIDPLAKTAKQMLEHCVNVNGNLVAGKAVDLHTKTPAMARLSGRR